MFKTTPYVIALYIRLSIEDSIENQKIALHKYADAIYGRFVYEPISVWHLPRQGVFGIISRNKYCGKGEFP